MHQLIRQLLQRALSRYATTEPAEAELVSGLLDALRDYPDGSVAALATAVLENRDVQLCVPCDSADDLSELDTPAKLLEKAAELLNENMYPVADILFVGDAQLYRLDYCPRLRPVNAEEEHEALRAALDVLQENSRDAIEDEDYETAVRCSAQTQQLLSRLKGLSAQQQEETV